MLALQQQAIEACQGSVEDRTMVQGWQCPGRPKGRVTMRRQQRKSLHYHAEALYDGTVIAAFPIRKPLPKVIKRDHLRIDDDGVCREWLRAGQELRDPNNETRFRFQNIIATSLNARRALREIVLPRLTALQAEIAAVRTHLGHIEQMLQQYHAKSEKQE